MEKQKTKLGARILTDAELKAILPDAESVYELIEMFRNSISKENDDQWKLEQKTNNIGIMGRRGAGKTSILRTFHKNLRDQGKDGDIILPVIVPENLSPGTTLMDVVLGMLKPVAEERKKDQGEWPGDCIYSGRNLLEQKYNEVVKQYCYIKKDYRDILIQQFTTEQNYVDKTKEVFNSDTEFIELFNQFIISLLKDSTETDESPMLFLFIDDIDLSTSRCVDVARALLSYLSNPRIVTFISGDLETFEEALTLEFLRQEGALTEGVIHEAYYSVSNDNDGQLLQRKKILAYQYLRKIIPPAYRKSIKYWSLEDRGNYRVEGEGQKSLAELLVEVSKNTVEKSYFIYRENDEEKHMGLAFHMLDDTSRGLNNVYNVLLELWDPEVKEADSEKGKEVVSLWRLIEVMIDAKPLYTKYKEQLLKQIVVLEQEQVKVNFADAFQLLYGKSMIHCHSGERFAIFLLIDFSAKLFGQEQGDNEDYVKLKNEVVREYLKDDTIDGRVRQGRNWLIPWPGHEEKGKDYSPMQRVLFRIIEKGDFLFILYLVQYLGREEIYRIWGMVEGKRRSEKELAYIIAYALFRAVCAMNATEGSRQDYLAGMYVRMPDVMLELLDRLSLDSQVIYGRQLVGGVSISTEGMQFWGDDFNLEAVSYWNVVNHISESKNDVGKVKLMHLLWAEHENENWPYWFFFQESLRESKKSILFDIKSKTQDTVLLGLTKTVMNQMQGVMEKYQVKGLKAVNYENLLEGKSEKEKKEWKVIIEIDKQGLWGTQYVEDKVIKYLKDKRMEYISEMGRGRAIFDATEFLLGAYSELINCDKGSSGRALVNRLIPKVKKMMFLQVNGVGEEGNKFTDGRHYLRLEQALIIQCLLEEFLLIHRRVKCGKKEIRKLLMVVKELPLVIHTSGWNQVNNELKEKEGKFFKAVLEDIEKGIDDLETCKNCKAYMKHKAEIKGLAEALNVGGELKEKWAEIEPVISTKDYIFIFHSYLRYLQANATDAAQGGAQAEGIAQLARYMLDSEIIADQEIQNEVYEKISKEIDLTEEEFEALF